MDNILSISNRNEFRDWLNKNHSSSSECWIKSLKRGRPIDDGCFYYLDAVEEALCFGWIDSVYKKVDGVLYQRFSPRKKTSNWTVLNVARVKRLQELGLMTEDGLKYFPNKDYAFDKKVMKDILSSGVYDNFVKMPLLYQQIRVDNLASVRSTSLKKYRVSFKHFVDQTSKNKMYGQWNDYERLK